MVWLVGIWVLALAVTVWWLLGLTPEPETAEGPRADPYADEVARFRREMHDWDRS